MKTRPVIALVVSILIGFTIELALAGCSTFASKGNLEWQTTVVDPKD